MDAPPFDPYSKAVFQRPVGFRWAEAEPELICEPADDPNRVEIRVVPRQNGKADVSGLTR